MARDPLGFLLELGRNYGNISMARLGPWSVYLLNDPELVEEVLVGRHKDCIKNKSLRDIQPFVGRGLLTSEHDVWRRNRKLVSPAMQPQRIVDNADTMASESEAMARRLADTGVVDVRVAMAELTLHIAAKTLLGVNAEVDTSQVGRILDVFMAFFERRLYSWEAFLPLRLPTPSRLRMRRAVRELDAIMYPIIERCRRDGPRETHLLARLVHDEAVTMTDIELRDEAVTMLLAGHETSALTLSYALFLLGQNPEARQRLREETSAFLKHASLKQLGQLEYLNAVIRETLRLYPPAYLIGREVMRPFSVAGYELPAGAQVMCSQLVIQRDPRFWRDPEKFVPERWLDSAIDALPRFAYFPFGGGPRICVGNHFALLEIAIALAIFTDRLDWSMLPDAEIELELLVTLRIAKPIRAAFVDRRA